MTALDVWGEAHYIARQAMNVLLLLSALLSALTGVDVGPARSPVAAEQVAERATTAVTVLAIPQVRHAPTQAIDAVAARRAVSALVRLPRFDLPAWTTRRRE